MADKIVPFKTVEARNQERESEREQANREEMTQMLEESLQAVRSGEIIGYVFVGRKRLSPEEQKKAGPNGSRDYFEYIVANALDVGLIGEIQVINNRLIALYDRFTHSSKEETTLDPVTPESPEDES